MNPEILQKEPQNQANEKSDFNDRMQNFQAKKKDNLEKKRLEQQKLLEEELQKHSFHPHINQNKLTTRTVEDMHVWGKVAKDKIIKKRREIELTRKNKHKKPSNQEIRNEAHALNRFVELETSQQNIDQPKLVDDRLYQFHSTYNSNKKLKEILFSQISHNVKAGNGPQSALELSVIKETRKMENSKVMLKQKHGEELVSEREKLKETIQKSAKNLKNEGVNFIAMNATQMNPVNSFKRKEIGLNVVKNLRETIRNNQL